MLNDIAKKYMDTYGCRFRSGQKRRFRQAITTDFEQLGYHVETQSQRVKLSRVNNVLVGSIKQAKYVFMVPYNTPPKVFWFSNKIYPQDGYKQMKRMFLPRFVPMIVGYLILLAMLYIVPRFLPTAVLTYFFPLVLVYLAILIVFIVQGAANKKNYVNNSASIAIALDMAERLSPSERKEVMFVFTDGNQVHLSNGNVAFQKYLTAQNKASASIIMLYCIGRGDVISYQVGRGLKNEARDMQKAYKGTTPIEVMQMGDDRKAEGILRDFSKAMMISTGIDEDGSLVVEHTATSKDREVNMEMVERISEGLVSFISKRKK